MVIQIGARIDNYTLIELIGTGGFAQVWKVRDANGSLWAMKIFTAQNAMDEDNRSFFRQEFEKTRDIQHRNVLSFVALGEFENYPYLISQLCQRSLMAELRRRTMERRASSSQDETEIFTETELAQILADVADGLAYLQDHGILHQDIKPDNILIREENGQPVYVIADFGVSTQLRATIVRQTQAFHKAGSGLTRAYASPEQMEGQVNKKSDIFSLGVTLFELSTGALPFQHLGITPGEAVRQGHQIPVSVPSMTKRMHRLISLCLQKEVRERPDAVQLLLWADAFLRDSFWPEEIERWKPGGKIVPYLKWVGIAAAALILLSSGGWYWWNQQQAKKNAWSDHSQMGLYLFRQGNLYEAIKEIDQALGRRKTPELEARKKLAEDLLARYDSIKPFSEGLAPVRGKNDNLWGVVDTTGAEVIMPQFESLTGFSQGFAAAQKNGLCGYIDRVGAEKVAFQYRLCNRPLSGTGIITDLQGNNRRVPLQ